jgi:hypothetical protein
MLIRQVEDRWSHGSANGPATLGAKQCQHLAVVVAEVRPDWSVELHHDVLGRPFIVILSDDLDDPVDFTLVVRRDDAPFRLEELCGDTYRKLGDCGLWVDVLRAVRTRLSREMPFPPTLH